VNTIIFVLTTLALALVLGLLAMEDPGYVLLSREPWEIEISLALFVLLLLLLFAALYLLVRMVMRAASAHSDLFEWRQRRERDRAGRDIMQGYARLIEGDWAEAERELTRRLEHSRLPLLNHLGAAYAAQQNGDLERRDAHLDAAAGSRRYRASVQLTRARLQYLAGQHRQALDTLASLPAPMRRRKVAERMEAEILGALGDRRQLAERLPVWRRHGSFSASELVELESQAYGGRYLADAATEGETGLDRAWSSLPAAQRKDPEIIAGYARRLAAAGSGQAAADHLRKVLHHDWHSELVALFAELDIGNPAEQLRQCEVWRERHPEDPVLLLVLARLTRDHGDPARAQTLFADAIRRGAPAEAYLELGRLLERSGDGEEALICYRRGLEAAGSRGSAASSAAPRGDLLPAPPVGGR
jgi:HemY protein